jgi:hypothetical protein
MIHPKLLPLVNCLVIFINLLPYVFMSIGIYLLIIKELFSLSYTFMLISSICIFLQFWALFYKYTELSNEDSNKWNQKIGILFYLISFGLIIGGIILISQNGEYNVEGYIWLIIGGIILFIIVNIISYCTRCYTCCKKCHLLFNYEENTENVQPPQINTNNHNILLPLSSRTILVNNSRNNTNKKINVSLRTTTVNELDQNEKPPPYENV